MTELLIINIYTHTQVDRKPRVKSQKADQKLSHK